MIFSGQLFRESFYFAIQAITQNKLRSILSLLGITIGIFSIITVFTFIDSLQISLQKDVNNLGSNVIYVDKMPWTFDSDYPWWKYWMRPQPSYNEMEDIERKCKDAEAVAYGFFKNATVKYLNSDVENVNINGISDEYNKVTNWVQIAEGRYITPNEFAGGSNVAIIGSDVADGLFGTGNNRENPLGKYVKIKGRKVMVVGVMKKQGKGMGVNMDISALTPWNFARTIFDTRNIWTDRSILVKARDGVSNDQLMSEIEGILRPIRELKPGEEDNFALNQSSMISNGFGAIFDKIAVIGWIVGGLSILVGGIGIANIMFVSVKERTSIIGIQKSLGAKNFFILTQFVLESIVLCLFGGIIGLIIIFVATTLIGNKLGMEFILTLSNIVLGLGISVFIGLISGFIPAYTASQLDPVEAIRSTY